MRTTFAVGAAVEWPNLRKIAGTVDIDGQSGGLLNDGDSSAAAIAALPAKICRYIQAQPGCKSASCGSSGTPPLL